MSVYHTQCPRCASQGQDTSKDNMAVYPNGQTHCFGCGYHTWPKGIERLKAEVVTPVVTSLDYPTDVTTEIPQDPLRWLNSYTITGFEMKKFNICWSPSRELLIFPVFGEDGTLLMWQGRNFARTGNRIPKYYGGGDKKNTLYFTGQPGCKKGVVILVEDVVSAIKVGRRWESMPLWGSQVPLGLIRKLQDRFEAVGIWLDRDKTKDSVAAALRASQYLPAFPICSHHDPKTYSGEFIDCLIEDSGRNIIEKISPVIQDPHDPEWDEDFGIEDYQAWRKRLFVPEDTASWQEYTRRRQKVQRALAS